MITDDKCAQRGTALRTLPLPPPRLPVLCQPALDTWSCSAGDRFLEPCQGPSAPGTKAGDRGAKTLPTKLHLCIGTSTLGAKFGLGKEWWVFIFQCGTLGMYLP